MDSGIPASPRIEDASAFEGSENRWQAPIGDEVEEEEEERELLRTLRLLLFLRRKVTPGEVVRSWKFFSLPRVICIFMTE